MQPHLLNADVGTSNVVLMCRAALQVDLPPLLLFENMYVWKSVRVCKAFWFQGKRAIKTTYHEIAAE